MDSGGQRGRGGGPRGGRGGGQGGERGRGGGGQGGDRGRGGGGYGGDRGGRGGGGGGYQGENRIRNGWALDVSSCNTLLIDPCLFSSLQDKEANEAVEVVAEDTVADRAVVVSEEDTKVSKIHALVGDSIHT